MIRWPEFIKKKDVIDYIKTLGPKQMIDNGKLINNSSFNPNTEPTANAKDPLPFINQQNFQMYESSPMKGAMALLPLIVSLHYDEFIGRFKPFFRVILSGADDYYYLQEAR